MPSDVAIRVRNLTKSYRLFDSPRDQIKHWLFPPLQRCLGQARKEYGRELVALDDISVEIKKGETVGIIGHNGSGKSTLLQAVSGTLTPTRGTVEVQGRVGALLELGAGFHPNFTGRENVYLNGSLLGLTKNEIDERLDDILWFADIGCYIDQPVRTYSSGMQVRLAFAVMAHVDADILLIDEALAVGDAHFVQKCMRFLKSFMERGTTLFVSHDTAAVLTLCERAILLDQGRAVDVGNAKMVCDRYLECLHRPGQDLSFESRDSARPAPSLKPHRSTKGIQKTVDREAMIVDVKLHDSDGKMVQAVSKRGPLTLTVQCQTWIRLESPIVGFVLRNRLGQVILGQNTFTGGGEMNSPIEAGMTFAAVFEFILPVLQEGDYTISIALAEGTQQHHVQYHLAHDAAAFRSFPTEVCFGFVAPEMIGAAILREL